MNERYYDELRNIFTDIADVAATTKDYESATKLFRIAERIIDVRMNIYMDMYKCINGYQE